ncbi:MAG: DNA gyrase subunit A [Candidatus Paracaedibacteraceae bacterium]|nr:DNA gyrase subunit A [Candidatus Paracaedibacteraceae bacterium]
MTSPTPSQIDIKPVAIEEEMKTSYLSYAMSVIVSRALPDVRDGLKPVHRRILYAMKATGNEYNRPYRKSARVVGEVMGKYHPHGDMAIYDAMVRLTQDFSLRVPLIDGQGNFGSMDGDPAAASRYTEARLSKSAHELLEDIDKDTVDFCPNYDESEIQPTVLPAKFPNLLINGGSGIAVGMATSIPTHNLGEVIDACCALIENPNLELADLMQFVKGPDFPTGGIIMGRHGFHEAFRTGRGGVVVRGKAHTETSKNDRQSIVITEIPYQVNKARLVEKIAELVKEKIIEGISDLRDESNRKGVRIVIEVKRDAVADVILNQLYRYSQLQTTISYNMLAIRHGRPEQLNLKQILEAFLEFREEVILRRTRFELRKAREKAHTLMGFAIAISNIDPIIELIRAAADRTDAKDQLLGRLWDASAVLPLLALMEERLPDEGVYQLSEVQANAILDLRLHRLTGLERDKIQADLEGVTALIQELVSILGSRPRVLEIMNEELRAVQNEYSTPRRTDIEESDSNIDMEDLIQKEDMVVTVSLEGYIKRVPLSTYRAQRRGGRGRSGMTMKDEDIISDVFVANTHSQVYFFSSLGQVYRMKVYRLPLASPQSKGRAIVNLLPLAQDEKITTILVLPDDVNQETHFLMFATSRGNVRRNALGDFHHISPNGKKAIRMDEGESLVAVSLCSEEDDVMLSTSHGICNRFNVTDIRIFVGRDSNGVRGIRLSEGDYVIAMTILMSASAQNTEERDAYLKAATRLRQADNVEEGDATPITADADETTIQLDPERVQELAEREQFILAISENGYGKRTSAYEYRTTNRGSSGFDAMNVTTKTGGLVATFPVDENDQIMLVTDRGRLIRCAVTDIRMTGRRAQGVIIFRVDSDEKVVAVSRIGSVEGDEEEIIEGETVEIEINANESPNLIKQPHSTEPTSEEK